MATIGVTDTTGTSPTTFYTVMTRSIQAAAYRYTATTGDTVSAVHVFGQSGTGTGSVKVAVYEYDSGTDRPTNKIGVGTVTMTNNGTSQWETTSGLNISLTNGTTYVVCLGESSDDGVLVNYVIGSGNERDGSDTSGTLANPWTHDTYSAARFMAYATVTSGGATPSIAADGTSVTVTMSDATLSARTLQAAGLSVAATGAAVTLTFGLGINADGFSAGASMQAAFADHEISAVGTSVAATMGAATLSTGPNLAASGTSVTATIGDAALGIFQLAGAGTSVVVTGQDATMNLSWNLVAAGTSVTVNGQAMTPSFTSASHPVLLAGGFVTNAFMGDAALAVPPKSVGGHGGGGGGGLSHGGSGRTKTFGSKRTGLASFGRGRVTSSMPESDVSIVSRMESKATATPKVMSATSAKPGDDDEAAFFLLDL